MYIPPKVDLLTRANRWIVRRVRRIPTRALGVIHNFLLGALIFLTAILVLYILSLLVVFNLLNIQIVLSFGVVEFFAFLLAKFFLSGKERKYSVEELIEVALNASKFAHLVMHYVYVGDEEMYPSDPRFILNTRTNSAYYVSGAMKSLARAGVIQKIEYPTDKELYAFLETNKTNLNRRFPFGDELGLGGMSGVVKG